MATATLKRTRAGNVSKTALDQVGSLLQDLPEKPKEQISLRDAVAQLQTVIKATLAKGYSYEDVAILLAEQSIVISPATLKRYVLTNNSRATQKRTSSKRNSTPVSEQPEAVPEKPRRGRPAQTTAATQPKSGSTRRSSVARGRRTAKA